MASNAFATMVFSAIVIANRSWPNAANYWAWQQRNHLANPSQPVTIEIATRNSLVPLYENAPPATKVGWSFSKLCLATSNSPRSLTPHEIIHTPHQNDAAMRSPGSSTGEVLPYALQTDATISARSFISTCPLPKIDPSFDECRIGY